MKPLVIEEVGYKLHLIKTKKFKTNKIVLMFKRRLNKEDIALSNIIDNILVSSSEKYKTRRELILKAEDLYNMSFSSKTEIIGDCLILSFSFTFLDKKFINVDITEEVINFMYEIIFNPNIKDSKFDENSFEHSKNENIEIVTGYYENPGFNASALFFKYLGENEPYSYNNCGEIDDLKKITNEEAYNYYKSVINNSYIEIFSIGDFNFKDLNKKIKSKLSLNEIKNTEVNYISHNDIKKEQIKIDPFNSKQSFLKIGIKIIGITEFERQAVLPIYNIILGGDASSKLFLEVREKNSFCYGIYSKKMTLDNLIIISSQINKSNFNEVLELIKKQISNMKFGDITNKELTIAKELYINSKKSNLENQKAMLNTYITSEYYGFNLFDINIIKEVTKKDLIDFSKKLYIDTIFLLKGDSNE